MSNQHAPRSPGRPDERAGPRSLVQRSPGELRRDVPAVVIGDLSLVRPLADEGVPVIVATSSTDGPVYHSRMPHGCIELADLQSSPRRARDQLLRLGDAIEHDHGRRPLLVYGSDDTLAFLYEHRDALESRFAMSLNDDPLAHALFHKDRFYHLAQRRGVLVPRTLDAAETPGAARTALDDLSPPLVVKPRSKGGRPSWQSDLFADQKALVFETREALAGHPVYRQHADELLVQERIDGSVTDLVSYHGFSDAAGSPLIAFCGRKLRTYPKVAGESALIEVIEDSDVQRTGEQAARRLGVVGPYKIDMIRNRRDGLLYVLEVNARFNLWNHLGAAYGINLLIAAYDYLVLGREPLVSPHRRPHVRWADLYRNSLACRDGEDLREVAWSLIRAPNVYATFSWTDPIPAVSWLGSMLKQKWDRVSLRNHR